MIKSILLALDDTPAALASKHLALELAAQSGARVTGIAVVDADVIAPPESTGIGGSSYKAHKDAVLVQRAKEADAKLAQAFTDEANGRRIRSSATVVTGQILAALIAESDLHDVIMAGVDTSFDDNMSGTVSALMQQLLHRNPRPVIISAKEHAHQPRTMVAYDGSVPAMRAMQMFCDLEIRKGHPAVVATIHEDVDAARFLSHRGAQYMREHGYDAFAVAQLPGQDMASVLIETAVSQDAGMIVAGAYGHGGWREWLLGSTTSKLLETSPLPIFVHH